MIQVWYLLLLVVCSLGQLTQASKSAVNVRERVQPLADHEVGHQEFNTTRTPSPNQFYLTRMYLNGDITRNEYEVKWHQWEDHHIGKATRWAHVKDVSNVQRRGVLDASASVVTIVSGLGTVASDVTRLARYILDRWNSRWNAGQGGSDDIESVATAPATSVRITLPPNPTGAFNAAELQGAMTDMIMCLNNGNAQRVCLTADNNEGIRLTASYARGNPGDAVDTSPPSDSDCESGNYDSCEEGPAPPAHDGLRKAATFGERDTGNLDCPWQGGTCAPACSAVYHMYCDSLGLYGDPGYESSEACKACNCNGEYRELAPQDTCPT